MKVEKMSCKLSNYLSGGDAIYSGQYRCSLGFNVTDGPSYYFLTAGHCGNIYALVKYPAGTPEPPGNVNVY